MTAAELTAKADRLSAAATTRDQHAAAVTAHYEAAMAYSPRTEDRQYHIRRWTTERRRQHAAQS